MVAVTIINTNARRLLELNKAINGVDRFVYVLESGHILKEGYMNTKTILIAIAVVLLCFIAGISAAMLYNQYEEKQQEQRSQEQMMKMYKGMEDAGSKL